MSDTPAWTVGRLLTWTTDYLREHEAENPRLDAEVLLAEARGCDRIDLYTAFDEPATEETRVAFRELVRRRAAGMPVAYLVGHREFYALDFHVTPDVLIPRPETEFVIIALLDLVKQADRDEQPLRIADVGTGSGVLAVCAAKHVPQCSVLAIDRSAAALRVARRNVQQHDVSERVELLQSDLFDVVPPEAVFDFVLSNPPYVSSKEYDELPRDVRDYEPRLALEGGPGGTDIIVRLIEQAAPRLRRGGWIVLEISPMIERDVVGLLEPSGDWEVGPVVKDLTGLARVVQARRR